LDESPGIYRVGNAAGESQPLVGEGMTMALQSAGMLVECLSTHADRTCDAQRLKLAHRAYANAWRSAFASRLRFASTYAQIAMHPLLTSPAGHALRRWPALLTTAARFAAACCFDGGIRMNTLETLQDILVRDYRVPRDQTSPESELSTMGLDSLSILELMFKIEDRFHVKIMDDTPTDLVTVNDVVRFIDGLLPNKAAEPEPNQPLSA
jgi:acyl carrier protein